MASSQQWETSYNKWGGFQAVSFTFFFVPSRFPRVLKECFNAKTVAKNHPNVFFLNLKAFKIKQLKGSDFTKMT